MNGGKLERFVRFGVGAALAALLFAACCHPECPREQVSCPSTVGCTDLQVDPKNCGACGVVCQDGAECLEGSCHCAGSGLTYCDRVDGGSVGPGSGPTGPVGSVGEVGPGCTDTSTDSLNCGVCGQVCPAMGCRQGQCPVSVLASNQANPVGIAVDADNLYWADEGNYQPNLYADGAIMKMSLASAAITVLASNVPGPSGPLALDSENVYWTFGGSADFASVKGGVLQVPIAGGAVVTVAANQPVPCEVAAVGADVLWTTGVFDGQGVTVGNGQIVSTISQTAVGGGPSPVVLVADPQPLLGILSVPPYLFWTDLAGQVVRTYLDRGSPLTFASKQQEPAWPVSASGRLYWANLGIPGSSSSAPDATIAYEDLDGGAVTTLVDGQAALNGMVADDRAVYWIAGRQIRTVPVSGGTATVVASGNLPSALAMDANAVYWTDLGDGTVLKLSRPQ